LTDLVENEILQRRETGHDVGDIERRFQTLRQAADAAVSGTPGTLGTPGTPGTAGADADVSHQLDAMLDELDALPAPTNWTYEEPTPWDDLVQTLALPAPSTARVPRGGDLHDKVLGGWLGRVAGNMLGKPVEWGDHWTPAHLRSYLEIADAWPLDDYFPVADPMPDGYELRQCWVDTTRGNVHGSSRDDDVDYTILGLHLLEKHGNALTSDDVAQSWMLLLPLHQTYTAERVAYRNLAIGLRPPATATHRNPYREWIGAQIRGDAFGYVCPGDPAAAARLAYVDAAVSHVANGIYGEMWAAALVAAAFTADTPGEALEVSLSVVPPRSRLAEALRDVIDMHARGLDWDAAIAGIGERYGHYGWVHTINNAAVIAAGLLWGDGDFTRTIALTVLGGLDTDSNGGTAGSAAGILTGAAKIPPNWTDPLQDTLRSALFGFDGSRISDLADRTIKVADDLANAGAPPSTTRPTAQPSA
jgi:ADP-ribosylglycohydrolase